MYVCMQVKFVCMKLYRHVCICMFKYASVCIYVHMYICAYKCVYMYIYITFIVTATVISPLKIQLSSVQYTAAESSGRVCVNVVTDSQASEPFSVFLMPMGMLQQQSASSEWI